MNSCLVVDDSAMVRKTARVLLEEMSLAVEEAQDGKLALATCAFEMPDAILLDWNMPVMNGLDFVRNLRSMPGGKAPVVVFCTSASDRASIATAMEAGADEYVVKPFDAEILQEKLVQAGVI